MVDRACGKASEAPPETVPVDIGLPELRSAADCATAVGVVTQAVVDGTCDRSTAKVLIDGIMVRLRALETTEIEARISELEKAAEMVDGAHERNGRLH